MNRYIGLGLLHYIENIPAGITFVGSFRTIGDNESKIVNLLVCQVKFEVVDCGGVFLIQRRSPRLFLL